MSARLLALLLAAVGSASGAGHEFDNIAKAIERRYDTQRLHIPFLGAANLFTKVVRPAGASGIKVAVFEDLKAGPNDDRPAELDEFMSGPAMGGLHPMIRAHSRGEATYIYAAEVGHSTRLLIATFARNQATVIEVKVSMQLLLQLLASPNQAARMFGVGTD